MARLNLKDFYIGVALYSLVQRNRDARPTMIETTDDGASFTVTTNTIDDVKVYVKYTGRPRTEGEKFTSWQIQFNDKDRAVLNQMVEQDQPFYLVLVLGNDPLYKTEIALLTRNEYMRLKEKPSFTVRSGRGVYSIVCDYYESFKIKKSRIESRLDEIKDSEIIPFERTGIII